MEAAGEWIGNDNDNADWRTHADVAKECLRYALETPGAEMGLMKVARQHMELALQMRTDAMSAGGPIRDTAGARTRRDVG